MLGWVTTFKQKLCCGAGLIPSQTCFRHYQFLWIQVSFLYELHLSQLWRSYTAAILLAKQYNLSPVGSEIYLHAKMFHCWCPTTWLLYPPTHPPSHKPQPHTPQYNLTPHPLEPPVWQKSTTKNGSSNDIIYQLTFVIGFPLRRLDQKTT